MSKKTPRILVIAGSDSGGGAGIQADIKTITMLGGHAMTAITAVTAQNTVGVQAVHPIPAEMVIKQIDAVVSDIGVDAIKIGMLGSDKNTWAVSEFLRELENTPVIFDPVMVATSGSELADDDTILAFYQILAYADLIAPNETEFARLGGGKIVEDTGKLYLVTGGDGDGEEVVDRLIGPEGEYKRWTSPRIETRHNHGTGCTLSSAIAYYMAAGDYAEIAIPKAREFVRAALTAAPGLGKGHGPMGHQAVDVSKL